MLNLAVRALASHRFGYPAARAIGVEQAKRCNAEAQGVVANSCYSSFRQALVRRRAKTVEYYQRLVPANIHAHVDFTVMITALFDSGCAGLSGRGSNPANRGGPEYKILFRVSVHGSLVSRPPAGMRGAGCIGNGYS